MSDRIYRSEMFMAMAQVTAARSSCSRLQVGCIITSLEGTQVVAMGYNGNARGLPNACDSTEPGQCGCIHAEVNALIKAPHDRGELVMYVTVSPCLSCAKLILNSAVKKVFYQEQYRDGEGLLLLQRQGVKIVQGCVRSVDIHLIMAYGSDTV